MKRTFSTIFGNEITYDFPDEVERKSEDKFDPKDLPFCINCGNKNWYLWCYAMGGKYTYINLKAGTREEIEDPGIPCYKCKRCGESYGTVRDWGYKYTKLDRIKSYLLYYPSKLFPKLKRLNGYKLKARRFDIIDRRVQ